MSSVDRKTNKEKKKNREKNKKEKNWGLYENCRKFGVKT